MESCKEGYRRSGHRKLFQVVVAVAREGVRLLKRTLGKLVGHGQ